MSRRLLAGLIAVIVLVAAAAYLAHHAGKTREENIVRIGTLRGGVSTLDVILEEKLDAKNGFTIKPLYFTRTLDLANALEKGDLDVAIIPVEFVAKLREKGLDIIIIAVDFPQNQAIIASNKSSIKSLSDLRKARIGAFKPTGTYAMFTAYMKTLEGFNPDPSTVNMPPPQLLQALARGDVDAIVVWEPLASKAVAEMGGRIIATYGELWRQWSRGKWGDNGAMIAYAARGEWARKHPDLIARLQEARATAAKQWNNNPQLAEKILIEKYGLTPKAAELCRKRLRMVEEKWVTREMAENIKAVWTLAKQGGYIKTSPEELAREAFWHGQ
ncbi:MAG: hypothetical protein DSY37_02400 [Hyperthermus sp.]|nr:MAG: hypothetical protein DSY37_02400 [Hyperthermus sp.]